MGSWSVGRLNRLRGLSGLISGTSPGTSWGGPPPPFRGDSILARDGPSRSVFVAANHVVEVGTTIAVQVVHVLAIQRSVVVKVEHVVEMALAIDYDHDAVMPVSIMVTILLCPFRIITSNWLRKF